MAGTRPSRSKAVDQAGSRQHEGRSIGDLTTRPGKIWKKLDWSKGPIYRKPGNPYIRWILVARHAKTLISIDILYFPKSI
jgi:hypothetical protein